ncbi:MAG TPA: polymer-forming cytoskeletal protein, partial [Actinomycetota bacterium]|nr:polymer-forming cytoskeletal protein [Actinomycetota bacterium]
MRTKRIASIVFVGSLATLALWSSPAVAQERDRATKDQIVLTGTLLVEADRTVDTALIFDGPARVDGTVEESLVVFNGDAEVTGTVGGDVVVFNGDLVIRSGAEVDGDLVTNSTPTVEDGATVRGDQVSVVTRFDVDLIDFGSRLAWWIGYSVSSLVLGMLLLAFAPRLEGKVRAAVRDRL